MILRALGLSLLLCATAAQAAIDTYEFRNDHERERFRELTSELRCPKCQNQNIADSDAPIAMDLRREIFRMFGEGKRNDEIISYLVDRYGDFVLYRPPLNSSTALLWFGPGVLLVGGLLVLLLIVRRRRPQGQAASQAQLDAAEQARLQALLAANAASSADQERKDP
ncbi:MAG: cytochrome c-type biogenesis protein CcmH [Pseudomonas sp.]|nr:cytochrome c-type biogenesis protein CcmH [Pseudomonas sp.]